MGTRDKIVAYCRRQLGCSYDTRPSGGVEGRSYNCSFLSSRAYRAAGLTIPSWQGHQNGDGSQSDWVWRHGHWVTDTARLRPGDLAFFGTSRANTGHVAVVSRRSGGVTYIIDATPARGVAERALPASAGFVGGGWPLAQLPAEDAAAVAGTSKGGVKAMRVRFGDVRNIRSKASTRGAIKGRYGKGDEVTIDRVAISDGYVWGHYVGATSGQDRWVALFPKLDTVVG